MEQAMQLNRAIETNDWVENNYPKLQEKYAGRLIAAFNKQIVAWGNTIHDVLSELKEKNIDASAVIVEYIPKKGEIIVI